MRCFLTAETGTIPHRCSGTEYAEEKIRMILSKKSRYGLRALVDLAVSSKTEHMALNTLADRNGISVQYLEQVFAALRRAGIVRSIKGPQGGYLLNRAAGEITVADIVLALDGSYYVDKEQDNPGCAIPGITETLQHVIIDPMNEHLDRVLQNVTLQDLEDDFVRSSMYAQDMYYI